MDYKSPLHSKVDRIRIREAACNLVCYDLGYKKVLGVCMVDKWIEILEESARIQGHSIGLKSRHKGTARGSFVARIEREHPTYLINLYWYATSIHGDDLTFQQLADAMNAKANIDQLVPEFNISVGQLKQWFSNMKGKQLSPNEKPYLTPEHLAVRLDYANRMLQMQREGRHICYLDEKWFYTTTQRKKLKYVPRQPYEAIGADYVRRRKVVSRRHSLKTMFIGVVAEANAEHEFDGKIMMERIAEDKVLRRATYRNQFHFDRHFNDEIKSGGWKQLYPDDPNILTYEFIGIIANNYDLEEEVEERLCLRYDTYPRGEKRTVTLGQNEFLLVREITEENGARRALTVDDLTLIQ